MKKIFKLNIPTDYEGYVGFECPYCKIHFKVSVEELKASNIMNLYCPICGLVNQIKYFYTYDVIEKVQEVAMNHAIDAINKSFKALERRTRSNKFITFKPSYLKNKYNNELYEGPIDLEITKLKCCNKNIKVTLLDKYIGVYCPYCGGDC